MSSNPNAASPGPSNEPFEDEVVESGQKALLFNVIPSWMVSFLMHAGLIIFLALLVLPSEKEFDVAFEASSNPSEAIETIDLDVEDFEESDEPEEFSESEFTEETPLEVETTESFEVAETFETSDLLGDELLFDEGDTGDLGAISGSGDETSGRTGNAKNQALKKYGGSDASEEAVQLALKWIINHQLDDGGWNLDHTIGPGSHRDSPNPGSMKEARNAATALALLPLLGNGQTHKVGIYKDQVRAGLEFLMARAQQKGRGVSFFEPGGTMYSHGLCSIVFCEAFAMTRDPKLAPFAQGSIWYMEDVQDPVGGGWRYKVRQAGDTSVVGWQIMALKSAKLSGLNINTKTLRGIDKFLNNISNAEGSVYGYDAPPTNRSAAQRGRTAIGLLCRMYLGWDKDTPGLQNGVQWLDGLGPDMAPKDKPTFANMYYNYYGTQVMKHYGGEQWTTWNGKMRDYLVNTQSKTGNTAGSWYQAYHHAGERGGRLYSTALACMTLEVYYRYLPIYKDQSDDDDFEL